MHRLTARLLLLLLLVGVVAPLALAISAPPTPACCRRNGMHHCGMVNNGPVFRAPCPCDHPSWLPLAASQSAHLQPVVIGPGHCPSVNLQVHAHPLYLTCASDHSHSGRAPPQFSIA